MRLYVGFSGAVETLELKAVVLWLRILSSAGHTSDTRRFDGLQSDRWHRGSPNLIVAVRLTQAYHLFGNGVGRGVRCRYLCPHTPVHITLLRIPRVDDPPPAAYAVLTYHRRFERLELVSARCEG